MAEEKNIARGYIGNALRSSAAEHTTTFTDEVFDTDRQKYQSEVNTDIESKIEEEAEARDLAINNETQARTQNDQLLSQAIAAEQERAEAAEQTTVTLSANQLKPAPAEGGEFNAKAGYKYYKLAYDDYDAKTGLGFYWGEANGGVFSVKAGTAYLAVPSTSNVKGFSFDGTSTGISAVDAEEPAKTRVIYNIAGQKVNAMTKAGLYIVNGKKIVIRK